MSYCHCLASRARGEYLRTHFKNMREVGAALTGGTFAVASSPHEYLSMHTGLKLTKAYAYLSNVKEHKQVIPFRRFNGGVGRASQAKQFKATQGTSYSPDVRSRLTYTTSRSLAREICSIHYPSLKKCRVECRREEFRAGGLDHQEHCGTASAGMYAIRL